MPIEQELKKFKTIFDREMTRFLDKKIREAEKISPQLREMIVILQEYISNGGKRIRPCLMYYTYSALGGKNIKEALKIGLALEFTHTFLLIHDDIIDRDNLRRGKPAVHFIFKKIAEKNKYYADHSHYGVSQAISIGDMCFGFVNEIISQSQINYKIKNKLLKKISDIIFYTTAGQFYDVYASMTNDTITIKDVLSIQEYKTARYTAEGPLHLGAIMAGVEAKIMKNLSDFSIPLGIAYQIQDDIIGVFGSSEETGKPVGADIREGKRTLLIMKSLEQGNEKQKKELNYILGNRKIGADKIERARKIIIDSGSLKYSQELAQRLIVKSDCALRRSGLSQKSKEFFSSMAEFIIKRKN